MNSSGNFPTTHWSLVARAAGDETESRHGALEGLLQQYLPAFKAHIVRVLRVPDNDADDLVQSFVCDRIVAEGLIGGADQARGRFRTYLLTALDRHVARVHRYESAKKRRPDAPLAELDPEMDEPAAEPSPSEIFDMTWARAVIAQAIDTMRKECDERPDIWGVFEARLLAPLLEGGEPAPYPELVERLRLPSSDVAANLVVTGKRMFARCLRSVVAQYMETDAQMEQEIADLRQILANGR